MEHQSSRDKGKKRATGQTYRQGGFLRVGNFQLIVDAGASALRNDLRDLKKFTLYQTSCALGRDVPELICFASSLKVCPLCPVDRAGRISRPTLSGYLCRAPHICVHKYINIRMCITHNRRIYFSFLSDSGS